MSGPVEIEHLVDALDTDDRYELAVMDAKIGGRYMAGWYAVGVEDGTEYGNAMATVPSAEGLAEAVAAVRADYENSPVAGKTRRP
jgi:hypothetical protein